jgi:hypothetical protein
MHNASEKLTAVSLGAIILSEELGGISLLEYIRQNAAETETTLPTLLSCFINSEHYVHLNQWVDSQAKLFPLHRKLIAVHDAHGLLPYQFSLSKVTQANNLDLYTKLAHPQLWDSVGAVELSGLGQLPIPIVPEYPLRLAELQEAQPASPQLEKIKTQLLELYTFVCGYVYLRQIGTFPQEAKLNDRMIAHCYAVGSQIIAQFPAQLHLNEQVLADNLPVKTADPHLLTSPIFPPQHPLLHAHALHGLSVTEPSDPQLKRYPSSQMLRHGNEYFGNATGMETIIAGLQADWEETQELILQTLGAGNTTQRTLETALDWNNTKLPFSNEGTKLNGSIGRLQTIFGRELNLFEFLRFFADMDDIDAPKISYAHEYACLYQLIARIEQLPAYTAGSAEGKLDGLAEYLDATTRKLCKVLRELMGIEQKNSYDFMVVADWESAVVAHQTFFSTVFVEHNWEDFIEFIDTQVMYVGSVKLDEQRLFLLKILTHQEITYKFYTTKEEIVDLLCKITMQYACERTALPQLCTFLQKGDTDYTVALDVAEEKFSRADRPYAITAATLDVVLLDLERLAPQSTLLARLQEHFKKLDIVAEKLIANLSEGAAPAIKYCLSLQKIFLLQEFFASSAYTNGVLSGWLLERYQPLFDQLSLVPGATYNSYRMQDEEVVPLHRAESLLDNVLNFAQQHGLCSGEELRMLVGRSYGADETYHAPATSSDSVSAEYTEIMVVMREILYSAAQKGRYFKARDTDVMALKWSLLEPSATHWLTYQRSLMHAALQSLNETGLAFNFSYKDGDREQYASLFQIWQDIDCGYVQRRVFAQALQLFIEQYKSNTAVTQFLDYEGSYAYLAASANGTLLQAIMANNQDLLHTEVRSNQLDMLYKLLGEKRLQDLLFRAAYIWGVHHYIKELEITKTEWCFADESGNKDTIALTELQPLHLHYTDLSRSKTRKYVRHTFELALDKTYTLIGSASNGKTTTLLSLALAGQLAELGLPILARDAQMVPPQLVFVSLNDERSNELGSRFKNGFVRIAHLLDKVFAAKKKNPNIQIIVAFDEIFRGTDDVNAAAGIMAVCEALREQGVFVVMATHFLLLSELQNAGLVDQFQFVSVTKDHQLTSEVHQSELVAVLEKYGFSQHYQNYFSALIAGEAASEPLAIADVLADEHASSIQTYHNTFFELFRELDLLTFNRYRKEELEVAYSLTHLSTPLATYDVRNYNQPEEFIAWLTLTRQGELVLHDKRFIRALRSEMVEYFRTECSAEKIDAARGYLTSFSELLLPPKKSQNVTLDQARKYYIEWLREQFMLLKTPKPDMKTEPVAGFFTSLRKALGEEQIENGSKQKEFSEYVLGRLLKQGLVHTYPALLEEYLTFWRNQQIDPEQLLQQAPTVREFLGLLKTQAPAYTNLDEYHQFILLEELFFEISPIEWKEVHSTEELSALLGETITRLTPYHHEKVLDRSLKQTTHMVDMARWLAFSKLGFQPAQVTPSATKIVLQNSFYPGQGVVDASVPDPLAATVRTSIEMTAGSPVVCTGDNMSGKTVTTKMVLFCAALANLTGYGLGNVETPEFDQILGLYKVESSQDESSSMCETRKIAEIIKTVQQYLANGGTPERCLVALDEVGSVVSSLEGSALAALLVGIFGQTGVFVTTTTHYHQLELLLQRYFPDVPTAPWGFVYDEQNPASIFTAQKGLRPGQSNGIKRAQDFCRKIQLEHREEVVGILEEARENVPSIQQFIAAKK